MMGNYVLSYCAPLISNRHDFLSKHSFGNIMEPRRADIVPILCAGYRARDTSIREKLYGISKY